MKSENVERTGKMKKWAIGVGITVAVFCLAIGLMIKKKYAVAISLIGGADGPTSIFIAGKIGREVPFFLAGVGVMVLAGVSLAFWKKKP